MTCCRHTMQLSHGYSLRRHLIQEKMPLESESESDSVSDNRFLERYLAARKARSKARGKKKARRGTKKPQPADCQLLRMILQLQPPQPEEEPPEPQDDGFSLLQLPNLSTLFYGAIAYCIIFWIITRFNYDLIESSFCTAETCDVPWTRDVPRRAWEPPLL
ncbi:uncharacterized protein RHO17_019963 [Thomomys bottae]